MLKFVNFSAKNAKNLKKEPKRNRLKKREFKACGESGFCFNSPLQAVLATNANFASPKIQPCLEKFKAKGLLARVAGFKLIRRWAGFDRPHLRFKFKVLIIIDENVAHHGL